MTDENKVVVFYDDLSSPFKKVAIALYEKDVIFDKSEVNLGSYANYENSFLAINPRGEVPVLQHGSKYVVDSNVIIEYIDKNFGVEHQFFPSDPSGQKVRYYLSRFEDVPIQALTLGVALFHREKVTDLLRHPFSEPSFLETYRKFLAHWIDKLQEKSVEHSGTPCGDILHEKSMKASNDFLLFSDLGKFEVILKSVESILDEIERELGATGRNGLWLTGPTYTAADICFTAFLYRLYQLGLDEKLWKGGARPNVAVYQELAFARPSFEKTTFFAQSGKKKLHLQSSIDNSIDGATLGLGFALAFGALYIYKKFRK